MIIKKWALFFLLIFLVQACGQATNQRLNASLQANPASQCNPNSGPQCGQPPMPPCPPNMFCTQVMPQPVTYQNECLMKEAKATFIQAGQCPSTSL